MEEKEVLEQEEKVEETLETNSENEVEAQEETDGKTPIIQLKNVDINFGSFKAVKMPHLIFIKEKLSH